MNYSFHSSEFFDFLRRSLHPVNCCRLSIGLKLRGQPYISGLVRWGLLYIGPARGERKVRQRTWVVFFVSLLEIDCNSLVCCDVVLCAHVLFVHSSCFLHEDEPRVSLYVSAVHWKETRSENGLRAVQRIHYDTNCWTKGRHMQMTLWKDKEYQAALSKSSTVHDIAMIVLVPTKLNSLIKCRFMHWISDTSLSADSLMNRCCCPGWVYKSTQFPCIF